MKTIDEMIAVMTAYKEGKKIERLSYDRKWLFTPVPLWSWSDTDYRVKPEPHYVPYDSVLEVERDKWVRRKRRSNNLARIVNVNNNLVSVYGEGCLTLEELFEKFEYEDGSPCGKLMEEE